MSRIQTTILLALFIPIIGVFAFLLFLVATPASDQPLPTLVHVEHHVPTEPAVVFIPHTEVLDASSLKAGQELIVQFKLSADAEGLARVEAGLDGEVVEELSSFNGAVVRLKETVTHEQIEALSEMVLIEPNYTVESLLTFPPNDPMISQQWSLEALNVASLWQPLDENSTRVVVAVIDSGVCFDHPDLQGRFLTNGYDFIDDDANPTDAMGHGCAISGIIAGNTNNGQGITGIAPHVDILPIRVLDGNGIGTYADVASAIYYAVDKGADIINLSLGGRYPSQILQQAVNHATQNGVDVIAGAGNSGQNGVYYPARYPNVVAVGSMNEAGERSSFSTTGIEVDTLAPGENIVSTSLDGGYQSFSGTSMAVPHISALYALSQSTGQAVDLARIASLSNPSQPDSNQVQALQATPTPTAGPSPTATITPPHDFRCYYITVNRMAFSMNRFYLDVTNNFHNSVYLDGIRVEWTPIVDFPNMYFATLALNNYALWSGNQQSPAMVTEDDYITSYNRIPVGSTLEIQGQFLSGPSVLSQELSQDDFAGTQLFFQNPLNPESPCIIEIPTGMTSYIPQATPTADTLPSSPPFAQCGQTSIQLAGIGYDFVSYYVEDVDPATDYLVDMDHTLPDVSDVISGTMSLWSIAFNNNTIWAGNPHAQTVADGTWLSSPSLDNDLLTIYYDTNFDLREEFTPEEFASAFHVYNNTVGNNCTIYPTISETIEVPPTCGDTPIRFESMTEDSISYRVDDVDIPQDVILTFVNAFHLEWAPSTFNVQLVRLDFDGQYHWMGPENIPVLSSNEGTWHFYTTLDKNLITFQYNAPYDLTEWLDPVDFYTQFTYFNLLGGGACIDNPESRQDSDPRPRFTDHIYEDDTMMLTWSYDGTGTHFIVETQVQGEPWEVAAQLPISTLSYEDTDIRCDTRKRWRVSAYDQNSNTYTQSAKPYWRIFEPCGEIPEPTDLTIMSMVSGVNLHWNISGNISGTGYQEIEILRQISGVDSAPAKIGETGINFNYYFDHFHPTCSMEVLYQVRTSHTSYQTYAEFFSDTAEATLVAPDCLDLAPPTDLTVDYNDTTLELSWQPANGDHAGFVISRQISGTDDEFVDLEITSSPLTTSYLDDTQLMCGTEVTFQIIAYYEVGGQVFLSQPATLTVTPENCIQILQPVSFTAVQYNGNDVTLTWDIGDAEATHIRITRWTSETNYQTVVNTSNTALKTYNHNANYTCDASVDYRIELRYDYPLFDVYSEPLIIHYDAEPCPRTDLSLSVTSNVSSAEPYEPVSITYTISNDGDEDANTLTVRQTTATHFVPVSIDVPESVYGFNSGLTVLTWTVGPLPAHTQKTLTFTFLPVFDEATGQMPITAEIWTTDVVDPDSSPNNGNPLEDDYAAITFDLDCPVLSPTINIPDGDVYALYQALGAVSTDRCNPEYPPIISLAKDGNYRLDQPVSWVDGINALPPIRKPVVIQGNGAILDGHVNDDLRAFVVEENAIVDVSDLTIEGFFADGAQNDIRGYGGGFLNYGNLHLNRVFIDKTQALKGTTIYSTGSSASVTVRNTMIESQTSRDAIVVGPESTASIMNSTIRYSGASSHNLNLINVQGSADIRYTTFLSNIQQTDIATTSGGQVTVKANLFKINTTNSCPGSYVKPSGLTSLGYNVSSYCSYDHPTDVRNGYVNFDNLSGIIGYQSRWLQKPNSDGVDIIPAGQCEISNDQNGALRPFDLDNDGIALCDAGSVESPNFGILLDVTVSNSTPADNEIITLNIDVTNATSSDATDFSLDVFEDGQLGYLGVLSATSGTVTSVSGTPRWTIANIPSDTTETLQLQYLVDTPYFTQFQRLIPTGTATVFGAPWTGSVTVWIDTGCPSLDYMFNVPAGDTEWLINAINYANDEDCTPGSNTINLAPDSTYAIDGSYDNSSAVPARLPLITSHIVLKGDNTAIVPSVQAEKKAIYIESTGSLTLENLTFRDFETTQIGGGWHSLIYARGDITIRDSRFVENNGVRILAVMAQAKTFIERSLFWNNDILENTQAIVITSGQPSVIQNSTFGQDPDRVPTNGIYAYGANLDLWFNTFIGQITNESIDAYYSNSVEMKGNILYRARCFDSGKIATRGYNVTNENDCRTNSATDLQLVDIDLLPLGDYGGSTLSIMPVDTSIVVDRVPAGACNVADDQRGVARPYNTTCDVGSVELNFLLNQPTSLNVTSISGTASLSWQDNSSDETNFQILRKGNLTQQWEIIATVGQDVTQYDDIIESCYESYSYAVRAFRSDDKAISRMSNIQSGIHGDCALLIAPVLTITAVSPTAMPDTIIDISWVDDNEYENSYVIENRLSGGDWAVLATPDSTLSSIRILQTCETTQDYRIQAYRDADNAFSSFSDIVTFEAGACPPPPVIQMITGTKSTSIQISWQPDQVYSNFVEIYRRPGNSVGDNGWVLVSTPRSRDATYVNNGLTCGTDYQYRLRNKWVISIYTYFSDFTPIQYAGTLDCLVTPTHLTPVSSTRHDLTFSWQDNTTVASDVIIIERKLNSGSTWSEVDRVPESQNQYTDTTVLCGTTYDYRLRAYRASESNYSLYSAVLTMSTDTCNYQSGPHFIVTTTEDEISYCELDHCSLRSAIESANNRNGADIIYLPEGTLQMTLEGRYEEYNQTGDFNIKDDLMIIGHVSGTTIDANHIDRIFRLYFIDFTLENVTLLNGEMPENGGTENDKYDGGTIHAETTRNLILNNVKVQDSIGNRGGAFWLDRVTNLTINNSRFVGIHSYDEGGVIFSNRSTLTINTSEFESNTAYQSGGALSISGPVTAHIHDSVFLQNSAMNSSGGAIAQNSGELYVDNTIFDGNFSDGMGGAISSSEDLIITNSLFTNNQSASSSGAIFAGDIYASVTVKTSSIINNSAVFHGGGIYGRNMNLEDVTISGNQAGMSGGGIYVYGQLELKNSTLADNTSGLSGNHDGGGLFVKSSVDVYAKIINTLIVNNTSPNMSVADCAGQPHEVRNSVIDQTTSCQTALVSNVNSVFGEDAPVSELLNIGNQYYHELLAGNPAINRADNALCDATDQIGTTRYIGAGCDIGSVESAFLLNPPTNLTGTLTSGVHANLTWQDNSPHDTAIVLERSENNIDWTQLAVLSPTAESYVDSWLACYSTYYYRVTSQNSQYAQTSETRTLSTGCEPLVLDNVTATIVNSDSIQITWDDNNRNESEYTIMRRITDTWQTVQTLIADSTEYTDTDVTCETAYRYRVGVSRSIDSASSEVEIGPINLGICPLYAPTGFATSQVTDELIDLAWTDNSDIESAYVLSRSTDNTTWTEIASLASDSVSYSDATVECEMTYSYQLQAYRELYDMYSTPVSVLSITTGRCNVAPPNNIVSNNQGQPANNTTQLNWNSVPPQQTSEFIIERAETENSGVVLLSETPHNWQVRAKVPSSITSFNDFDLKCGMTYTYRIQGYNARYNEYSAYSDGIEIITAECPVPVTNTVGLYQNGTWMFRNGFDRNDPTVVFAFGPQEAGWIPLTGDWDGDGIDGIGIYKAGQFLLRDVSSRGAVDYSFYFGSDDGTWLPIAGDWNGDGITTVGVYKHGQFQLTNTHRRPQVEYQFYFGTTESGWQPIVGDWNHVGSDRVGLYKDGTFMLHSNFKSSATGSTFVFGPTTGGWQAVAGDWDKDGVSTIGVYRDGGWRLRNSNSRGDVDHGFAFAPFNGQAYPLASYRGGEEAVELLAFYSSVPVNTGNPNPTATNVPPSVVPTATVDSATIEATLEPEVTQDIVPTDIPATATPTFTPEPSPTMEPTATDQPTAVPSSTAIPPTEEPVEVPENVSGTQ